MVRGVFIIAIGLSLSGVATGTTYTYVGQNYTTAHSPYTTAMSLTGTFVTATPLPASMIPATDIGPAGLGLVTAWSFSDGVNTFTQANSYPIGPSPGGFNVATDALGNITVFAISLQSPLPPNTVGELMNTIHIASPAVFGALAYDAISCAALITDVCDNWFSTLQYGESMGAPGFSPNFTGLPPTIQISFTQSSVLLNRTISLSFLLTNPNVATTLTGVAFTDSLPAGLVIATPSGLSSTCGGTSTAVQGTGSVSLTGVNITPNNSCTLAVNVTATVSGHLLNTTGPVTANESLPGNTASAPLDVLLPVFAIPTLGWYALWLLASLLAVAGAVATKCQRREHSR